MSQLSNKIQSPKTKVAGIIIGLVGLYHLLTVKPLLGPGTECVLSCYAHPFASQVLFIPGLLLVLSFLALFLLLKYKCQSWWFAMASLIITILIYIIAVVWGEVSDYYPGILILLIVIFLLISDRKNYFAAVEKAKDKTGERI